MPTLAACILARDAAHLLPGAIESVLGHVDKVLVYVDDRTQDGTIAWLESQHEARQKGLTYALNHFDVSDGFSGSYNRAQSIAATDWVLHLDCDERLDVDQVGVLRSLCVKGEKEGTDCWGLSRYNWFDWSRKQFNKPTWPDIQWRLFNRRTSLRWRVHSAIVGSRRNVAVPPETLAIHHFNHATRSQADWDKTNALYAELMSMDLAEGRIP
jgi:glycosyltransferase involved in cell wall biosynthesis